MRFLLDTNILMKICHPKQHAEVKDWLQGWLDRAANGDDVVIHVSAAADYELRRGYLWKLDKHPNEPKALKRLDQLLELLDLEPVSNNHLRVAATYWADARRGGYATAPERDLDWDVIIATQAAGMEAVVVTNNTDHLSRYGVDAKDWSEIPAV
jgi:predicted nucleic acid-binding protein